MIHPTALVDPKSELDSTVEVGPYCVIGPHVKIGARTVLKSHVVIENRVTMGTDNTVYPFALLGGTPADLKFKGEPTELIIGSHNVLRESISLHIGTEGGGGKTILGDHNLIMAYVHLGHDVILGSHDIIANGCQLAGHVIVGDWVTLGGLSAVSQFCRLGAHAYIGGCSGIHRDVPPFSYGTGVGSFFGIKGINIIGLKRRGLPGPVIQSLMAMMKVYLDETKEIQIALLEIENQWGSLPEVREFLQFVRSTKNGLFRAGARSDL